jgi:hypothetical protein
MGDAGGKAEPSTAGVGNAQSVAEIEMRGRGDPVPDYGKPEPRLQVG